MKSKKYTYTNSKTVSSRPDSLHPFHGQALSSSRTTSGRDSDHPLDEMASREINHYIDQVCGYLYAEETFLNFVREQLETSILKKVKKIRKKSITSSRAVWHALRETGKPETVAARIAEPRATVKITIQGVLPIFIAFLTGIAQSGLEEFKEHMWMYIIFGIIGALFLIGIFILPRILDHLIPLYKVTPDGLLLQHTTKTPSVISWSSIAGVSVVRNPLIGRYIQLRREDNTTLNLYPFSTNYSYVASSIAANVNPEIPVDTGVYTVIRKHLKLLPAVIKDT